MTHRLDIRAKELETQINGRIQIEYRSWSRLEVEARAEMIAEEVLGDNSPWEYTLYTNIGGPPQFVLTRYDPRRAD